MANKKLYDENGNEVQVKENKPFYKKWWFWLIIVIAVIAIVGSMSGDDNEGKNNTANVQETTTAEQAEAGNTSENSEEQEQESEKSEQPAETSGKEIVIGEPMEIGDYTMTIKGYELTKDYEGNDALIVNYDWENNSDEEASPFMTFIIQGFQDGVQTNDVFVTDGVDLGIGQKEIKAGGKIEDAQDVVGIDDKDKPLLLEIDELISLENDPYSVELDLSTLE